MKSERVAVKDHEITKRQRYREIVAVLARHGFGVVDDRMLKHETKEQARSEQLRLACEELGDAVRLVSMAGVNPPISSATCFQVIPRSRRRASRAA